MSTSSQHAGILWGLRLSRPCVCCCHCREFTGATVLLCPDHTVSSKSSKALQSLGTSLDRPQVFTGNSAKQTLQQLNDPRQRVTISCEREKPLPAADGNYLIIQEPTTGQSIEDERPQSVQHPVLPRFRDLHRNNTLFSQVI